jgi:predicted nuclease of predicted toxin-antitoxin system
VKFVVDAQLPPALTQWISTQGHDAVHVFDLGFHTADDQAIWRWAESENAVIISKDEDFVDQWLLSPQPASLVWIRKGNCSNEALLEWLGPLWPGTVARLQQGERLVELRG